ncbi:MAG: hypothetical protein QNI84_08035 [Henriciella sp.]|nr:hypothetical protein [Henriciella sp.]
MKVRGILFSEAMVGALLVGVKTQTRRLAGSPMLKAEPGDLFYVREAWRTLEGLDPVKPSAISAAVPICYEQARNRTPVAEREPVRWGKLRPSIFLPRRASRLTLKVTERRFEALQMISAEDAEAEGLLRSKSRGWAHHGAWVKDQQGRVFCELGQTAKTAEGAFSKLWDSLHGRKAGEAWVDNPQIGALTFEVIEGQVDALLAEGRV